MTDMARDNGKVTAIYIGSAKGAGKARVASAELVAGHGLLGDSHAGSDTDRQVSLFDSRVLRELRQQGFEVTAEQLSANIFTDEIDLDSLSPGSRLRLGGALLEIIEERKPCRSISAIDHRLPKKLIGRCGRLARVISGAIVSQGDRIGIASDVEGIAGPAR